MTQVSDEMTLTQILEELANEERAESADGLWRQSTKGEADLCGPIADEPPPLAGEALEQAEAADAALAEAEAELAEQAKSDRLERLKAELKEAEEDV